MPTNLGELVYTLTLNDAGFADQVSAADDQMTGLADTAETTGASFVSLGDSADDAAANLAILQKAAVGAVGDITVLGDETAGTADIVVSSSAEMGAAVEGSSKSMIASFAPLLVALGAYEAIKSALSESNQIQAAQVQIAAGLKSTGDASGETMNSLMALATQQEKTTDFSKAQVLSAESLGLTYTNIGKTVFPQTVVAAENISQKFGVALPNAMKIVGKAMEDPAKGMAKLQRYIGTLNTAQTDQIKSMEASGNTVGAQTALLQDLADKTGGSATAATETLAGKYKELKNEAIDKVSTSIETLSKWIDKHIKLVTTLAGVIVPLVAGILAIVTAVKIWTTVVEIFNAISDMNPFLLAITAIALIAIEVVTHWNDVKQWFNDFWSWIKGVFDDIVGFVKTNWELLAAILIRPLAPVLIIWREFHDQIIGFFEDIWSSIKGIVSEIATVLSGAFKDAFNAIIGLWDDTMGKLFHGQKISVGPVHFDLPDLNIPKMADGGIVNSATLALIGEAGPEAVVPLGKGGAGMGTNYNFAAGSVVLSTKEAVDEFFSIGNRNTQLEQGGMSPLAGTAGV